MASKPLPDNQKEDSYVYEILGNFSLRQHKVIRHFHNFPLICLSLIELDPAVLTGSQNQATCKSKVQFILTGEKEESDIRTLPQGRTMIFTSGYTIIIDNVYLKS